MSEIVKGATGASEAVKGATTASEATEKFSRKKLGFWIYLMTDCILFATLFATFAVLRTATASGPSGAEIFNLDFVLLETIILLVSSFSIGLAVLAAKAGDKKQVIFWSLLTFILGASFLTMELWEFNQMITEGHSWRVSAFLSAYFVLVGTHGLHILVGLIWLSVMIFRFTSSAKRRAKIKISDTRRLELLGLFWHFLDVIWIFIFSFVYLIGVSNG